MERSRYCRELVHCNVGTIGVFEADKTTLGVALANTLNYHLGTGEAYSLNNEDNVKEIEVNTFLINTVQTDYETGSREYTHIDCLNSEDCMKHMIIGTPSLDAVILVLDAREGITSEIREQLDVASKTRIRGLVVFVDNCDLIDDDEFLERMDDEIWEIIEEYEYPGYDTPIVKGSIQGALDDPDSEWGQKILELAETLDEYIPDPEKDIDKPFVMPIKRLFIVTGRGTVAVGEIESGIIKLNDKLEVVGYNEENLSVTATGIEMYQKLSDPLAMEEGLAFWVCDSRGNEIGCGKIAEIF